MIGVLRGYLSFGRTLLNTIYVFVIRFSFYVRLACSSCSSGSSDLFLRESCLAPLGILYLPTCVGFGYRYPFVEGRSSFSWEYGMGYFSAVAPGTRTLARGIFSTPSYPEKTGAPCVLEPITIFRLT